MIWLKNLKKGCFLGTGIFTITIDQWTIFPGTYLIWQLRWYAVEAYLGKLDETEGWIYCAWVF